MVFESFNYSKGIGCSRNNDAELLINCSNLRKEQLGIFFNSDCKERNADCSDWNNFCVCHCYPGYFMYYGHCIKGNLVVGDLCESSLQCTGSEHSELCRDGVCICQKEYLKHNNSCYLNNVLEAGRCVLDTQCRETENNQSNHRCVNGRCVCEEGYAMINHTCHEANLSLNKSCIFNDQCSGSPYASCFGEKCSCIEGYQAVNSTDCVLSMHGLNEAILKTESHESPRDNIRAILGALLGGLLFGIIITTGTVYALYRRSRYSIHTRRKEPGVMYAANDTFDDGRDEDTFQNNVVANKSKDKQKKVLNVSPLTRPQELPEYSNMSEKESAMTTMDDVYNHLKEKGETQDEDTYDHACAAAKRSYLKDLDDYSNIHNMDDGTTMSGGTENDDYSTLEHN
ncbi:uncharacterized protein LOC128159874 isoform X2 [Crassostrea angulata]|uniref:uncharacterized protein LOC128159874 isoform X2 n=1 Tax=Magallana angulata TaxID=2784310 RepID=UPI0022B085D1|nr:uncharacterized protein LOC128159874 isoform X2 [Crassostrea angulata]